MRVDQGLVFSCWGVSALLLYGCGNNGTGPNNGPAFAALSKLDTFYVAYTSPNAVDKPDTISFSFSYNPSKVRSIKLSATLDSGKSWIRVSSITPNNSGKAAVVWIPKSDTGSAHFKYFGEKRAFLRVEDTVSHEMIESEKFDIVGREGGILFSPVGGEIFSVNDSIPVIYGQNQDLSGRLDLEFSPVVADHPDSNAWIVPKKSLQLAPSSNLFIKFFTAKFTLSDPNNFYDTAALPPIRIVVADYGKSPRMWMSGPIAILK